MYRNRTQVAHRIYAPEDMKCANHEILIRAVTLSLRRHLQFFED